MNTEKTIRGIMTTDLVTIRPGTSARDIYDIFKNHTFHHLPVLENGEVLVGIISKEDFFRVSYLLSNQTTGKTWSEKHYQTLEAKDFMTQYPMTLDPDDTVGLAADIILANKFHALPVIEDHRLIGMVTAHDLLAYSFNTPFVGTEPEAENRFLEEVDDFFNHNEDDNALF